MPNLKIKLPLRFPEGEFFDPTEVIKHDIGHITLHRIVAVYRGLDMVVCEDVL